MRRTVSFIAALTLLAVGASGCTALLTGGKREPERRQTLLEFDRTPPSWISTNASRPSSNPTRS